MSSAATAPAAVIEADGIRVVFFRAGDRYAHRVEVWDARQGAWCSEWESVEGTPDEGWPASPPLQQLHVEQRPEGKVALLIGMAGRTHWSAAVEVVRVGGVPSGPRIIRFDVAARVSQGNRGTDGIGRHLTSTYRRNSRQANEGAGERQASIRLEVSGGPISAESETCNAELRVIRPGDPPPHACTATTVAWRYAFEVEHGILS
jgi:hypothetical protein